MNCETNRCLFVRTGKYHSNILQFFLSASKVRRKSVNRSVIEWDICDRAITVFYLQNYGVADVKVIIPRNKGICAISRIDALRHRQPGKRYV